MLEHLQELFPPTPYGIEKSLAIWDDLPVEIQAKFLESVLLRQYPSYLAKKILLKAFESPNAYIRYLSVKPTPGLSRSLKTVLEKEEFEKISTKIFGGDSRVLANYYDINHHGDPSSLVRFSNIHFDKTADSFFKLPQLARLSIINNCLNMDANIFATILEEVPNRIANGEINIKDVHEVISEYFGCGYHPKYYTTNSDIENLTPLELEAIKRLWKLVLVLPESLSEILCKQLPVNNYSLDISEIVIHLNGKPLEMILNREDMNLDRLRRSIFFNPNLIAYRNLAVSKHFHLSHEEFYQLLPRCSYEQINEELIPKFETLVEAEKRFWHWYIERAKSLTKDQIESINLYMINGINNNPSILSSLANAIDLGLACKLYLRDLSNFYTNNSIQNSDQITPEFPFAEIGWNHSQDIFESTNESTDYTNNREIFARLYLLASSVCPWHGHSKDEIFKMTTPNGELNFLNEAITKNDRWLTFMKFYELWSKKPGWEQTRLELFLPDIHEHNNRGEKYFVNEETPTKSEGYDSQGLTTSEQLLSLKNELRTIKNILYALCFISGYLLIKLT